MCIPHQATFRTTFLHFITTHVNNTQLKRSITKPYNVIFSMTGKFMGKAALCPPILKEVNMSQNSVVMKCESPQLAAFLCIYLNSMINSSFSDYICIDIILKAGGKIS